MTLSTDLFERSSGLSSPIAFRIAHTSRLVHALQPAPHVRFDGYKALEPRTQQRIRRTEIDQRDGDDPLFEDEDVEDDVQVRAQSGGVNAMVVDKFEGRYVLTGGADGEIRLWDLEAGIADAPKRCQKSPSRVVVSPVGIVPKSQANHQFGITALSFYPFDSLAFLSTSYDRTLKIFSSTELKPSASFDLDSKIYAHALSPIASHLLAACATQHPAVRLVDLRTGATTHSLVGHNGAILSVAWSPKSEHVLASGSTDGSVRFWDVRRSAGTLGVLDLDDSVGVMGHDGRGISSRRHNRGRAHVGAVNGIVWTSNGSHVVTAGHDERIRVWDMQTGANTLANFGPTVKNRQFSTIHPIVLSRDLLGAHEDVLIYPNERNVLMYELFDGNLIKRMQVPGFPLSSRKGDLTDRHSAFRVTAIAWRAHNVEMLSAHADGTMHSWQPRTREDAFAEAVHSSDESDNNDADQSRKRRRGLNTFFY